MYDDDCSQPVYRLPLARFLGPGEVRPGLAVSHDDWVHIRESQVDMDTLQSVEELTGGETDIPDYGVARFRNGMDVVLLLQCGDGDYEPVGQYVSSTVNIVPAHRGKGLGPLLVLAAAAARGGIPNTGDYTRDGHKAHLKAHRLAVTWALRQGHDVPDEVLADYPDIVRSRPGSP